VIRKGAVSHLARSPEMELSVLPKSGYSKLQVSRVRICGTFLEPSKSEYIIISSIISEEYQALFPQTESELVSIFPIVS